MSWPRARPTKDQYASACPWTKTPLYAFSVTDKWPMVDHGSFPFVRVEGIMQSVDNSSSDSPFIHHTNDVDMKLQPRPDDRWLLLEGDDTLVMETEQGGMPVDFRPRPLDHVVAVGRWIFDCGHAGYTEVHPLYQCVSDRVEVRRLWGGGPAVKVRVVNLWMNPVPGYGYPIRSLSQLGPLRLHLPFASTGKRPFLKFLEWDMDPVPLHEGCAWRETSAHVTPVLGSDGIEVTITVDELDGERAKILELLVGMRDAPHVGEAAAPGFVFPDAPFWQARLADGPGPYDFGVLTLRSALPLSSASPIDTREFAPGSARATHIAYLQEGRITSAYPAAGAWAAAGRTCPDLHWCLGLDNATYLFATDDFADLDTSPIPSGTVLTAQKRWPGYAGPAVPKPVADAVGWLGGEILARSTSGGAGDLAYRLSLGLKRREPPPSPGTVTSLSPGTSGRLIDLATPAAGVIVIDAETTDLSSFEADSRRMEGPWAWQQRDDEVHHYTILLPPTSTRPEGQPPCPFDLDGYLRIAAHGMHLRITNDASGADDEADDLLEVGAAPDLATRFPARRVELELRSASGRRRLYRLDTSWFNGLWHAPHQCAALKAMQPVWYKPIFSLVDVISWRPGPGGDPPAWIGDVELTGLGHTTIINLPEGGDLGLLVAAAPATAPVRTRLYDETGVLVATSGAAGEAIGALAPGGLQAHAQIEAQGLAPGRYLLQVSGANAPALPKPFGHGDAERIAIIARPG